MSVFSSLRKQWIILFVLFILGFGLRSFNYQSFPLGFDQVILLENAEKILSGRPVLIGPKTGYADIFIGPLTYYLTAVAMLFSHSAYALVIYQLVIVSITMLIIITLSLRYLPKYLGWTVIILWMFSPFILHFDRMPWNPSLLNLASILTLFPLLSTKKFGWMEWTLVGAGCFLGFQSHFSGIFLPLLTLLLTIKSNRPGTWMIRGSAIFGFSIGYLPLLAFDIRHQFMNLNGLKALLLGGNSSGSMFDLGVNILRSTQITVENTGKILFFNTNAPLFIVAGIAILITAFIIFYKHKHHTLLISLSWVILIGLFYGFYKGPRPEYYYLIQFPGIILVLAHVFNHFQLTHIKLLLAIILGSTVWLHTIMYSNSSSLNIDNLLAISSYVHKIESQFGVSQLSLDMSLANRDGLAYLLRDIDLHLGGKQIHISYPDRVPYSDTKYFEGISVWTDPRLSGLHLTEPNYIILYQSPLGIYKSFSNDQDFGQPFSYVVFNNDNLLGKIYIIDKKTSEKEWQLIIEGCIDKPCEGGWQPLSLNGKSGYIILFKENAFFFVANELENFQRSSLAGISFY